MVVATPLRWKVGAITITSILEDEIAGIPPEFFFPAATAEGVLRHPWVVPDYADAAGLIALRVQALVVEVGSRRILVDPCVGNGKTRALPFWHLQDWPFMERLADAGFDPDSIDVVVHTHLHADHIGWDTHRDGDTWVPTFTRARHLYTDAAVTAIRRPENRVAEDVWADSIEPIFDAGLADIVAEDADLGDGLRLGPTPGHTPGHVSLWIESDGERAVITGDLIHHPVQCSEPGWNEIGDDFPDVALRTRHDFLASVADAEILVVGTHFPHRPAGKVVRSGPAWQFVPAAG